MHLENDVAVEVHAAANDALRVALRERSLEQLEATADDLRDLPPEHDAAWQVLSTAVREVFERHDHVVLRGMQPAGDPRVLLAAATILGKRFRRYGSGKVVKVFSMSPWSRGLAHAGTEGFFHTDLNASADPPALTGIQCVKPDPGAPEFGHNRIVRLRHLIDELRRLGADDAIAFLTEHEVELANERSPTSWRGRLVQDGMLRFHPETIRTACARHGGPSPETVLHEIQKAAMTASVPLSLDRGDILLFSNHRTLHYRSECSVRFIRFPMVFEAREIHVLHVQDELGCL